MKVFVMGARGFPGVQGGIERHCEELYTRLAAYKDIQITIFAISRYSNKVNRPCADIDFKYIHSITSKNYEKIYYGIKASIYSIIKRPDIVHIHGLNCAIFIPLIKLFGIKVIFTQHSRDYLYPKWGRWARVFLRLSEHASFRADRIIAVSDLMNDHIKHFIDRSITIPNGVNTDHELLTESEEQACLDKYNLSRYEYIFFAGRFTQEKAIEDLLEAFAQLNNNSIKLVIAGDAEFENEYSFMIKNMARNTPNVILTGFIQGIELRSLYSNAKLFVLPSKHEGLPLALLEAMSHGIEVLASDIDENLQIGLDKHNYFRQGDIGDLARKMNFLLSSEYEEDVRLGRLNMLKTKYNWDSIAGRTFKVYQEVI